jgi:hypothetical protein
VPTDRWVLRLDATDSASVVLAHDFSQALRAANPALEVTVSSSDTSGSPSSGADLFIARYQSLQAIRQQAQTPVQVVGPMFVSR